MQRRLNALGIIIAVTAAPAMAQTKQQMERFARESSLIGTAGFAISSTGASPGGGKVAEVPVLSAMMGFSHKDNGLGVSFGTLVPLEDGEGDALLPDVDKQEALINSLSFRWEVPYLPDMVTHTFSYSHTYFPQGNTIGIDVMKSWGMRTRLNVLLNPSVGFSYNLNKPFRGHVNASAGLSESVYQSGFHNVIVRGGYAHRTYRFAEDPPYYDSNNRYTLTYEDGSSDIITPRLEPGRTSLSGAVEYRLGPMFVSMNRVQSKDKGTYDYGSFGTGTVF